jgi:tRNA(Arg) A34 adenosine deaminase TadA
MEVTSLEIKQLYPEYFFLPLTNSLFFTLSLAKQHTSKLIKDLNFFNLSNSETKQKVPVLSNKYRHLKRIFNNLQNPDHNLVLLLEEQDLRDINIDIEEFKKQLGNHIPWLVDLEI